MTGSFSMNSDMGQRILALVRQGDYAHAGEEEAIDLAMADVAKNPDRLVLDAGCGRGGTAHYLSRQGWGRVIGIDIEAHSISSAQQRYPDCRFSRCDVSDVDRCISERPDIICMFNAYYCFKDQPRALRSLANVAHVDTTMIIFDHVDRGSYQDDPLMDAGEYFLPNPVKIPELADRMIANGWQAPAITEIHDVYAGWYMALLRKIESARVTIVEMAGEAGYAHVHRLYQGLIDAARQKRLGAAIITTRLAK